ncbi:hypothetical protein C8255_07355 [filamentous cyanobacterium CCP3]|nr:hypothetical protein C8255_07355 [filamentous cyanobacterium CCP3]
MDNTASQSPDQKLIERFVKTQDFDIKNLLPSQIETGIKLEEKQEQTRSQLATFLIKILAGTLVASFSLIFVLIVFSAFVDERRAANLDKQNALVKDLITFILTAQTGLIGTALGFYFGSRNSNSD